MFIEGIYTNLNRGNKHLAGGHTGPLSYLPSPSYLYRNQYHNNHDYEYDYDA